jgi:hypothetical protein
VSITSSNRIGAGLGSFDIEFERTSAEAETQDSSGVVDMDELSDSLGRFEMASRIRGARSRAEERFTDDNIEAGQRQDRGDEPTTVDSRPEGGSLSEPDRDVFTASQSPDTTRSGPTDAQQEAFQGSFSDRGRRDFGDPLRLSTRESQLAAAARDDIPLVDIRTSLRPELETETQVVDTGAAFRSEITLDQLNEPAIADGNVDGRLDASLRGGVASDSGIDTALDDALGVGGATDTGVRTGFEVETGVEAGIEFESGFESRTDLESEFETGTETEVETGFESVFESETESETETETETETPLETRPRTRAETFGDETDDRDGDAFGDLFGSTSSIRDSGIASGEDALEELTGF